MCFLCYSFMMEVGISEKSGKNLKQWKIYSTFILLNDSYTIYG